MHGLSSPSSLWFCWIGLCVSTTLGFQVTGARSGFVSGSNVRPERQEISDLAESGSSWDLHVLALQRFQNELLDNETSYFQVAGIHGYPVRPWNGVAGSNEDLGFCMHNSVLFPIWHRPYLALFEQILSSHAVAIAASYPEELRREYTRAAERLRLPYWDWARRGSAGLPRMVTATHLRINTPTGKQDIENPFLQYKFPVDMAGSGHFKTEHLISNLDFTARHIDPAINQSNEDASSAQLLTQSPQTLMSLYDVFSDVTNYTEFAAYQLAGQRNLMGNIESVHGDIHNAVGGTFFDDQGTKQGAGHMIYTMMSAYDPIFWLHHTNVDRIFALWQALYPNSFVEPVLNVGGSYFQPPNTLDTIDSPLAPFYADNASTIMWTASMARDVKTFGYTYPELLMSNNNVTDLASHVRQAINELYSPSRNTTAILQTRTNAKRRLSIGQALSNIHTDTALQLGVNNLPMQWKLKINVKSSETGPRFAMYVFVDEPNVDASCWDTAMNLVGIYKEPVLFDSASIRMPTTFQSTVQCTHIFAAAVDRGILEDMSSRSVVPFARKHISVKMIDSDGRVVNLSSLPSLEISIESRSVQPRASLSEFPMYSAWQEEAYLHV